MNFILRDGEMFVPFEDLNKLESDMIDHMLGSGMKVTEECELDCSVRALERLLDIKPDLVRPSKEDLEEIILLADYFKVKTVTRRYLLIYLAVILPAEWNIHFLYILEIEGLLTSMQHASINDVINLIYQGIPYDHACRFFCGYYWSPIQISIEICNDPRCTPEIFADYFTLMYYENSLWSYVKRGLLDPACALKIVISGGYGYCRMKKLDGTPLKIELNIEMGRGLINQSGKYFKVRDDSNGLIERYELWDLNQDKCLLNFKGDMPDFKPHMTEESDLVLYGIC